MFKLDGVDCLESFDRPELGGAIFAHCHENIGGIFGNFHNTIFMLFVYPISVYLFFLGIDVEDPRRLITTSRCYLVVGEEE